MKIDYAIRTLEIEKARIEHDLRIMERNSDVAMTCIPGIGQAMSNTGELDNAIKVLKGGVGR